MTCASRRVSMQVFLCVRGEVCAGQPQTRPGVVYGKLGSPAVPFTLCLVRGSLLKKPTKQGYPCCNMVTRMGDSAL